MHIITSYESAIGKGVLCGSWSPKIASNKPCFCYSALPTVNLVGL
jgi:hypothetical protein